MPGPTTKEGLVAYLELHIQQSPDDENISTVQIYLRAVRGDDRFAELLLKWYLRTLTADEAFELRALAQMYELRHAQEQDVPIQTSRLLKLAPELRNRIYEYALVPEDGVRIEQSSKDMALLKTCSLIRKEASSMFFAQNTFHASVNTSNYHRIIDWLHLHAAHVPEVRHFSIEYQPSSDELEEAGTHKLPNGSISAERTTAQLFLHVRSTSQALLRQMRTRTLLDMTSVTAPVVELPSQDKTDEYLKAQVARYWGRLVTEGGQ